MKKIIKIEDKKIEFESNGRTLRMYRMYFKSDFLQDIMKLNKEVNNDDILGDFDYTLIENIAWICAKTADESIPEIEEWLEQFDSPLSLMMKSNDIIDCVMSSIKPTIKPKKTIKKNKTKA